MNGFIKRNHPILNYKLQTMPNNQAAKSQKRMKSFLRIGKLGFVWSLVLGIWNLAAASLPEPKVVEIYYDMGNSKQSVAVLEDRFLEEGDLYNQNFRIIDFEPQAVIVRDQDTEDTLRWEKSGDGENSSWLMEARNLFAAKQMRAIYEAQVRYQGDMHVFAPDLETLMRHGYLDDGFNSGIKIQHAFFIQEAGERRGPPPHYEDESYFYAIAEPQEEGGLYFAIDAFGQLRFSPSRASVMDGPIWDYTSRKPLKSIYHGVNPEYDA